MAWMRSASPGTITTRAGKSSMRRYSDSLSAPLPSTMPRTFNPYSRQAGTSCVSMRRYPKLRMLIFGCVSLSDHRVAERQVEFRVPVHHVGAFGVVGRVHPAGVRVAPQPLDHGALVERGRARGLEQLVDGLDRAAGGAHLVPAGASPQLHRHLLAGHQQGVLLGHVTDHLRPGGVDVAGRLG